MSKQSSEIVRRIYDDWQQGDFLRGATLLLDAARQQAIQLRTAPEEWE